MSVSKHFVLIWLNGLEKKTQLQILKEMRYMFIIQFCSLSSFCVFLYRSVCALINKMNTVSNYTFILGRGHCSDALKLLYLILYE